MAVERVDSSHDVHDDSSFVIYVLTQIIQYRRRREEAASSGYTRVSTEQHPGERIPTFDAASRGHPESICYTGVLAFLLDSTPMGDTLVMDNDNISHTHIIVQFLYLIAWGRIGDQKKLYIGRAVAVSSVLFDGGNRYMAKDRKKRA